MATELGVAYIQIIPSLQGVRKAVADELGATFTEKEATAPAQKTGSRFGKVFADGLQSAATAGVGALATGMGVALTKGFSRLNAIDQAKAKLQGLGNSAETVEIVMGNALESVKGTAFGMDAAATAAAGAMAAGIKPGAELTRNLKLVADAATIAGSDMGSMGAIFNKVAASNKVQMDVINQLHDAGVPALQFIADTMGVTAEEASKMASAGKIDFATFQKAMENGLGGAALSSGATFSGAMDNVLAAIGRVGAKLMEGFFPKLAPLLQSIQTALGPVEEKAKILGETIGQNVTPAIEWVTAKLSNMKLELGGLEKVLGLAGGAMLALGSAGFAPLIGMIPGLGGLASALGALASPIGLVAAAFAGLVATSPGLREALGKILEDLAQIAMDLMRNLQPVIPVIGVALIAVVEALAVVLEILAEALGHVTGFLREHPGLVSTATIAFAGFIGTLKALAGLNTVFGAVKGFIDVFKGFIAPIGRAIASFMSFARTFGVLKAVIAGVKLAWVALSAAFSTSPIGLLIAAITALVAGLIWFFTQTQLGKDIVKNVTNFIKDAWENLTQWVTQAWSTVSDFFAGLWEGIKTLFSNALQFLVDLFMNWTIYGLIIQNWDTIVQFFADVWNNIKNTATTVWNAISDFFASLWEGIKTFFSNALQFLVDLFMNWTIYGLIIQNWDTIVQFFADVWNNITNTATTVWNALTAFFTTVWNNIKNTATAVWNGVVAFVTAIWNNIVRIAQNLFNGVINTITNAVNFARELPGRIIGFFSGLGGRLFNSGKSLIQGFINGISNAFQSAKRFVEDGLAGIRALFPFSPAKEGPFSGRGWVAYSGTSVGETFAQAVANSLAHGKNAITSELDDIQQSFNQLTDNEIQLTAHATNTLANARFDTPHTSQTLTPTHNAPTINIHNPIIRDLFAEDLKLAQEKALAL